MKLKKEYRNIGIVAIAAFFIVFLYLYNLGQPFAIAIRESQARVGDPIHWTIFGVSCTNPTSGSVCNEVKVDVLICPTFGQGCNIIVTKSWQNAKYNIKLASSEGAYTLPTNMQSGTYDIKEIIYNDGKEIKQVRWKTIEVLSAQTATCTQDSSLCQPFSSCDKTWCAANVCQHSWAVNRYCAADLCGNGIKDTERGETAELCPKDFQEVIAEPPIDEPLCPVATTVIPTCEDGFEFVTDTDANGCEISSCVPIIGQPPELDSDGDGISDTLDACPSDVGVAELNGCPEKVKPPTFFELYGVYVIISVVAAVAIWLLALGVYAIRRKR